jgi:hypothetical protein
MMLLGQAWHLLESSGPASPELPTLHVMPAPPDALHLMRAVTPFQRVH